MTYLDTNFSDVENVGLIDCAIRGSVGIALLLAVLLTPTIPATAMIAMTLLAIYACLTAFISWDPFYALMKKSRHQPSAPTPGTVTAHPRMGTVEQPASGSHKKAA